MLFCCEKCSFIKPETNSRLRLHQQISTNGKKKTSGFTIIEVLVVLLAIGILSGAAVGTYSGIIEDTRIKSASDRIQVFFQSCKSRAKLRNQNVRVVYNEKLQTLMNPDSATSFLEIPDIYSKSIPNQIEIGKDGKFRIDGKEASKLHLALKVSYGKLATITIEL